MTHQVPEEYFYRQFDRHPEGQERTEATARHAAFLLNQNCAEREKRRQQLSEALRYLRNEQPVNAALYIARILDDDE